MSEAEKDMTTSSPFGALKQVDVGLLDVGYAEAGPPDGHAVLLLHGWPYDIHSFAEVTPLLAAAGYRVIVPFVRGFGTTRFVSDRSPRNGQQAALAADVIAYLDARSASRRPSWPASTGARGRPTSSRRCFRSGARPWSR
jgi:pimeloyl-ACP methyl ester carboxylesterase